MLPCYSELRILTCAFSAIPFDLGGLEPFLPMTKRPLPIRPSLTFQINKPSSNNTKLNFQKENMTLKIHIIYNICTVNNHKKI